MRRRSTPECMATPCSVKAYSGVRRDAPLLVSYPSRAAFIDMVTSPEYLEANRDRQNGAEKHVILASKTLLSAPFAEA